MLPLGALSSRSAPSMLVGALFKMFGLFLNTGVYSCDIFDLDCPQYKDSEVKALTKELTNLFSVNDNIVK
jgi:hypothetical protein